MPKLNCWTKQANDGHKYVVCSGSKGQKKPKPEPPKPKPKPKPKKKKEEKKKVEKKPEKKKVEKKPEKKKEEEKIVPTGIMDALIGYSKDEPIRWACYGGAAIYIYLKILAKHSNDCVFGFASGKYPSRSDFIDSVKSAFFSVSQLGDLGNMFGLNLKMANTTETQERLLTQYRKCKKNGKILCVPYFKQGHANMLIFNFHTNTIEYYEPHGQGTKPFENSIKKIAKYFNGKGEKMGVSHSVETCPKIDKATQIKLLNRGDKLTYNTPLGLQGLEHSKRQRTIPEQKAETGGFCCMWSFLHMDYRLSHPTKAPNALSSELVERAKKNPVDFFRKYIRGYTDELLQDMYKAVGKDTVRMAMSKGGNKAARWATAKKLDPFILKMWKDAGGKI